MEPLKRLEARPLLATSKTQDGAVRNAHTPSQAGGRHAWSIEESLELHASNVRRTHCARQAQCAAGAMAAGGKAPDNMPMNTYLKAWRLSKKLSLETVAELLGKTHTTISRWETGVVRIKATDLEKLAAIYSATPTQLAGPPESADMILILDRTQSIVEHMDAETLEQWLAIGERLSKK